MKTKTVKIELSLGEYEELLEIAAASSWTIQKVVHQCIKSGMPPTLTKVPDEFHDELLALNGKGDRYLIQVIDGNMPSESESGQQHKKADFSALRRTYAVSLLRWRGHPVISYETLIG
ncbi:MAG: hypothetical protein GY943_20535 [Chloroflexi bacterium]|nr:hypothetical protein [Chloroflexota bacterium]